MCPADPCKIVVLETDPYRRDNLRSIIAELGHIPFCFASESICIDNLESIDAELIVSGPLPSETVFVFLNTVKIINWYLPILMIAGDPALEEFVTVNRFDDVVISQYTPESEVIKAHICRILKTHPRNKKKHFPLIIGNSPEIVKIKKMLPALSRSRETVFIRGENGTGKNLLTRVIHQESDRRENAFLKVDSASLPTDFFEKDLSGRSEEYFTDKAVGKKSLLETVHNGTIFFDQIQEMPAALQPRMLQILDDRGILAFHSGTGKFIDVKMIVTANTDLEARVEGGSFRKDLFYRLNVLTVEVPPLRNRIDDLPLLTDFFTHLFCNQAGKGCYSLSDQTNSTFCRYHWPGNVRELKSLVKTIVSFDYQNNRHEKQFFPDKMKFFDMGVCEKPYPFVDLEELRSYLKDLENVSLRDICGSFVIRAEKKLIEAVLRKTEGNRKKTALMLGISYRSLLDKIKAYNLRNRFL